MGRGREQWLQSRIRCRAVVRLLVRGEWNCAMERTNQVTEPSKRSRQHKRPRWQHFAAAEIINSWWDGIGDTECYDRCRNDSVEGATSVSFGIESYPSDSGHTWKNREICNRI